MTAEIIGQRIRFEIDPVKNTHGNPVAPERVTFVRRVCAWRPPERLELVWSHDTDDGVACYRIQYEGEDDEAEE